MIFEIITTIANVVAALAAVWVIFDTRKEMVRSHQESVKQAERSNKEALFDKRVEVLVFMKQLLNKSKELREKCKEKDDKDYPKQYQVGNHTVCSYLSQVNDFGLTDSKDNYVNTRLFFNNIETLNSCKLKVEILWPGINNKSFEDFADQYYETLKITTFTDKKNYMVSKKTVDRLFAAIDACEIQFSRMKEETYLEERCE